MGINKKVGKANKDIPLGGDYALDAFDNPIVVYEDRSGRRSPKKKGK